MPKLYKFKEDTGWKSGKNNKPYRIITVHDPETLENMQFFINAGQDIDTSELTFKDDCQIVTGITVIGGRAIPTLEMVQKIERK